MIQYMQEKYEKTIKILARGRQSMYQKRDELDFLQ